MISFLLRFFNLLSSSRFCSFSYIGQNDEKAKKKSPLYQYTPPPPFTPVREPENKIRMRWINRIPEDGYAEISNKSLPS